MFGSIVENWIVRQVYGAEIVKVNNWRKKRDMQFIEKSLNP